jgi:membrane protein YdbS with pleckstrin-like domain
VYSPFKSFVLRCLHLPERPPDPPAGGYRVVRIFRASPKWLRYRLVLWWIGAVFAFLFLFSGAIGTAFAGKPGISVLLLLVIALEVVGLFFSYFCVRIEYDLRTYVVTDRSLRVREGAFVFKEMTLTYANVQNVQVLQGPLQRMFGIQDLRVDTAGGGASNKHEGKGAMGHSVTLAGLENAREVRDLILSYVKVAGGGSGLGDLDDRETHARGSASGTMPASASVVEALRALRESAQALRQAAEKRARAS